MKARNDTDTLWFVAEQLKKRYTWVKDVVIPKVEDYGPDMLLYTKEGKVFEVEVKSTRKGMLKLGEHYNDYFRIDNKSGMFRSCDWKNAPAEDTGFSDINETNYRELEFKAGDAPVELKDKYCYVLNASAKNRFGLTELMPESCKFYKMMASKRSILIYVAVDGMLLWNNTALRDAFIGYTFMECRHTEDFYDRSKDFELKALIDMEKAVYVKFDQDDTEKIIDIFQKY